MQKFKVILISLLFFGLLSECQTVKKKTDEIFKKENELIFDKILECLKSGNFDSLQIDGQLLDQIEKYANIKHIVHKNDKDESKIVEIFNDIKNELKTHDLELRIQELESKFAEDFNQNTFDEINRLKKEQNIN